MNNYLNSLNDRIKKLPESYRKKILIEYENHFKEGFMIGKNENDTACDIGEVDVIAKGIIDEYYIKSFQKEILLKIF